MAPAPYPDPVWWKWEALEYLASADAVEGGHVHNPVVAALGLVKAHLIRFGIGNMVTNTSAPQSGWPRLWVIPPRPRWRKSAELFCVPGLCGFTSG